MIEALFMSNDDPLLETVHIVLVSVFGDTRHRNRLVKGFVQSVTSQYKSKPSSFQIIFEKKTASGGKTAAVYSRLPLIPMTPRTLTTRSRLKNWTENGFVSAYTSQMSVPT